MLKGFQIMGDGCDEFELRKQKSEGGGEVRVYDSQGSRTTQHALHVFSRRGGASSCRQASRGVLKRNKAGVLLRQYETRA